MMAKLVAQDTIHTIESYKELWLSLTPANNFDRAIWDHLEILSASGPEIEGPNKAKVTFSVLIPSNYANHIGTLHTGITATLFDGLTSSAMALIAHEGFWDGNEVTRSLEVKCYRPIPLNERFHAECEIVHAAKRLATITGVLKRAGDGAILAACQHEKFYARAGDRARL